MKKCQCGCGREVGEDKNKYIRDRVYYSRVCFLRDGLFRSDPSARGVYREGGEEPDFSKPATRGLVEALADIGNSWALGVLRDKYNLTCFTDSRKSIIFFSDAARERMFPTGTGGIKGLAG